MIIKRLAFAALNTLQDAMRALREIEQASQEEMLYLQDTDPGAVGAKKIWLHSDGTFKVRAADNESWLSLAGGGGGGGGWETELLRAVAGPAAAEAANQIDVPVQLQDSLGSLVSSSLVDFKVVVSDGATDHEPSATATLSVGGAGSLLSGGGTATAVYRTNGSGLATVRVSETLAAHRYLWIHSAGNTRKFVVSKNGVFEIIFT